MTDDLTREGWTLRAVDVSPGTRRVGVSRGDATVSRLSFWRAISFANLGGHARLVVPRPLGQAGAYAHLAAFVRSAPPGRVSGPRRLTLVVKAEGVAPCRLGPCMAAVSMGQGAANDEPLLQREGHAVRRNSHRDDVERIGPERHRTREALCRAELEQAHGRTRAVHRARPGRALHVGIVLPSRYGWTSGSVEIRSIHDVTPAMEPSELRSLVQALEGRRAAARALGCSPASAIYYWGGKRGVPKVIGEM